jgi:hypothetical protein
MAFELMPRKQGGLFADTVTNVYADEVKKAYSDLKAAENYFDNADDPDLIDFAIYDLEAAKKKYSYMLKKARQAYKEI